jgi:hypothetical protein
MQGERRAGTSEMSRTRTRPSRKWWTRTRPSEMPTRPKTRTRPSETLLRRTRLNEIIRLVDIGHWPLYWLSEMCGPREKRDGERNFNGQDKTTATDESMPWQGGKAGEAVCSCGSVLPGAQGGQAGNGRAKAEDDNSDRGP